MSVTQAFTAPGGHDAALTQRADDLLERWPVAKLIYRMITATPLGWSTRIGLYGQWGSGKTSVLNFLQQIAEDADDIVVRFPAWQVTGEEGFIAQFYLQLTAVLEHKGLAEPLQPWLKRLSKKVTDTLNKVSNSAAQVTLPDSAEYAPMISAAAHVSGVVFDKLSGMLQLDAEDLNALHQQLGKRRVIVFIDDLDRADPKVLPQTLLALRELLDWPDFVFVLAFDKEVVSRALHSYSAAFGESAQHFLDKIIDVPFTLPAPTPKQVQRMVAKSLQDSCGFLPPLAIEQCAQWFPGNPRYAKRICRSLSVFGAAHDRHEKDELDWRGIILQTLLRESEPGMAEYFTQNYQEISSAFRPPMLTSPNEEACNRHRQAALAMTPHAANSPQGTWALGLFEEVTKARIDSQSWLEKINYEMSLAVLVPAFTFPGLKQFFNTWREHRAVRIIHEFIDGAVERSGEAESAVAADMLKAVNILYAQLHKEAHSNYSRDAFESSAGKCVDLLELMALLYGGKLEGELAVVGREPDTCVTAIRTFFDFLSQDDTALDRELRQRERALACDIARRCNDPTVIYRQAQELQNNLTHSRQDPELRMAYLQDISQSVIPELISRALELFFTPNGIANAYLTGESKYLWVLNPMTSPLYQTPDAVQQLERLMRRPRDPRQQAVVAENAMSYLGNFGLEQDGLISLIPQYSAPVHARYIELAWEALMRVEPRIQTLVYLEELHRRLVRGGVAVELLPLPEWWNGREGDIRHPLQSLL
ncbi:hypothetical protein BLX41_31810 [Pseudomonas protegens]|uniref:KAP family P-loop NTPase fold protein n=1 Tax=Pseudomonas protegens TaxID=380021 RepID=UPI000F4B4DF5|nr:P-loop NTPase fold protein [Pseudomonas protegens]ROL62669.1 hypothetical protein BLX41_31810 [Pseudomonas protegens]